MSKSQKLIVLMRRELPKNDAKMNGKLTNDVTLTQYKRNTTLFCNWAEETYGITREHHIAQNGFDRVTLAQRYCDHLIVKV